MGLNNAAYNISTFSLNKDCNFSDSLVPELKGVSKLERIFRSKFLIFIVFLACKFLYNGRIIWLYIIGVKPS